MKKNYLTAAIAVLLIAVCAFMFCACDETATQGESAYQIAVRNGFQGSEQEWLNSLKGADGADGQDGENGADGQDGVDGAYAGRGYSAYELAVANGFDGTIADWLESLEGERGDTGASDVSAASNKAITSVVSIYCNFNVLSVTGYNPFTGQYTTQESTSTSAGSGVIIDGDIANGNCYIITNYHVVYNASATNTTKISSEITVYLYGMEYSDFAITATYVGGSLTNDIAVLKVTSSDILKNSGAAIATVASSNDVVAGDSAVAIGNPAAGGISVTSGVISTDSEYITMTAADNTTSVTFRVMRIDAAINGGNSGGGLFNTDGALVGIVNAKITSSSIENIAYALPSDIAVSVARNIIRNCDGTTVTKAQQSKLGYVGKIGDSKAVYNSSTKRTTIIQTILVDSVTEGSAAATAGLQAGDKILYFTYGATIKNVTRLYQIADFTYNLSEGDTFVITVERGGSQIDVSITIGAPTAVE